MSEAFLGVMRLFGFNFAPMNWALANGAIMAIQQNTALFSLLGTNFGGDGVRTFGLPDVSNNVIVGAGDGPGLSPYVVGEQTGENAVTITTLNMPPHTHSFNGGSFRNNGDSNTPGPKVVYGNVADSKCTPYIPANATPAPTMVPMLPTALTPFGSASPLAH